MTLGADSSNHPSLSTAEIAEVDRLAVEKYGTDVLQDGLLRRHVRPPGRRRGGSPATRRRGDAMDAERLAGIAKRDED